MKISLNIFTNCTNSAPDTDMIKKTLHSFWDSFEPIPLNIYVDENPNRDKFQEYYKNLSELFPEIKITKTNSLSDGYIRSIQNSKDDYLFQCEHDWLFNNDLIKHSLEEICYMMNKNDIYHMRFNKRSNIPLLWDSKLVEKSSILEKRCLKFMYCETPCLSNNPHIVDVKKYHKKCLPFLKLEPGSKGIEEHLTNKGLTGCIYGEAGYPATIIHQDGRNHK